MEILAISKTKPSVLDYFNCTALLLVPMDYFEISLIYILVHFLGILAILSKEHKVVIVNTYILGSSKCFWSTELSVMTLNEGKKRR